MLALSISIVQTKVRRLTRQAFAMSRLSGACRWSAIHLEAEYEVEPSHKICCRPCPSSASDSRIAIYSGLPLK